MRKTILVDQYHIDIKTAERLTKAELKEIEMVMKAPDWIATLLKYQFSTSLRNKISIEVNQ